MPFLTDLSGSTLCPVKVTKVYAVLNVPAEKERVSGPDFVIVMPVSFNIGSGVKEDMESPVIVTRAMSVTKEEGSVGLSNSLLETDTVPKISCFLTFQFATPMTPD